MFLLTCRKLRVGRYLIDVHKIMRDIDYENFLLVKASEKREHLKFEIWLWWFRDDLRIIIFLPTASQNLERIA